MNQNNEEHYKAVRLSKEGRFSEAFLIFDKLAALGCKDSMLRLAEAYYYGLGTNRDVNASIFWAESASSDGDAEALYFLGTIYESTGRTQQALGCYERLSSEGYYLADYRRGCMYLFGYGVGKNIKRAQFYLKISAKQGHLYSIRYLAYSYYTGRSGVLLVPVGVLLYILLIPISLYMIVVANERHPNLRK